MPSATRCCLPVQVGLAEVVVATAEPFITDWVPEVERQTLKRLATEEVNVSTVEDPIEMIEPAFNQTQVQVHLDLDFAQGLRALMRQDPDILMVGEIRDLPTAEMAVQAALTGHLGFPRCTPTTRPAPSCG
jgi:general secretion pathway protein E